MNDDIVARLRVAWDGMGCMANAERKEAADEIERLRDIVSAMIAMHRRPVSASDESRRKDMFAARTTAFTFEHHRNPWIETLQKTLDEACRIRFERDEARREACELTAELDGMNNVMTTPEDEALERGWDCFTRLEGDDDDEVHVD